VRTNQVHCKDCDYMMVAPNQAQSVACCMFHPPEARLITITDSILKTSGQQVLTIRPVMHTVRQGELRIK